MRHKSERSIPVYLLHHERRLLLELLEREVLALAHSSLPAARVRTWEYRHLIDELRGAVTTDATRRDDGEATGERLA